MGDLVARPSIVFESEASVEKSRIFLPRGDFRVTPTPGVSIVLRGWFSRDAIKAEARRNTAANPGRFA